MATSAYGWDSFYSSTLSSPITASDTTIPLVAAPTAQEGVLVIESNSSTNREIIYYTSVSGSSVICPSVGAGRGQEGTTAMAHSSGVSVKRNTTSRDFEVLQDGSAMAATFTPPTGSLTSKALTNPYKFYAYQSSGQAVTTGADRGPINLQTKLFDTGTNFATGTGLFTAPIAGFYFFSWAITLPIVNNSVSYSLLYVNAAATSGIAGSAIANSTGGNQTLSTIGSGMLQLAANDTVGLYVNTGSNVTINAFRSQTYLQGYLICAT